MKHINAIVAYHMIEKAKAILRGETEADSVKRVVMPQPGEPRMIAIKHNGELETTSPATMREIEKALTDNMNKRVEVMNISALAERIKELEDAAEKERIQKIERSLPTNAA